MVDEGLIIIIKLPEGKFGSSRQSADSIFLKNAACQPTKSHVRGIWVIITFDD
jgi:hypothetical protein